MNNLRTFLDKAQGITTITLGEKLYTRAEIDEMLAAMRQHFLTFFEWSLEQQELYPRTGEERLSDYALYIEQQIKKWLI